jgi:cobyrinic acid a,c-diamide synthase
LLGIQTPMAKGLIIAATASGSGKTTLTLALLAAFRARGLKLAPFKVGPDFIDPGHHRRITGGESFNLDGWMLTREYNQALFARQTQGVDLALVEGVMGLFDGFDGRSEAGSTAQMAKWLGLPVLLVVDARSMARSAAALVQGFERFDPEVRFAGVLFNRIGSPRHLTYLNEALQGHVKMACWGGIPREVAVKIPERHLGLHTAEDHPLDREMIQGLAALVETHLYLDRLLESLPAAAANVARPEPAGLAGGDPVRIGVARDAAFCFYYPENLELLAANGAQIVSFSPLAGDALPQALDGLYFGGGYPELHAAALSQNRSLRQAIHSASLAGMPIYAECGGFMYLCDRLTDSQGTTYPMAGCFPFATRMLDRRKALGYREVRLKRDAAVGPAGLLARGHEFHYSEIVEGDRGAVETIYATSPRSGGVASSEGFRIANTLGSYIHLHFGSNPVVASHFTAACRQYQNERMLQE